MAIFKITVIFDFIEVILLSSSRFAILADIIYVLRKIGIRFEEDKTT